MDPMDVMTNEFFVRYDESEKCILIHTVHENRKDVPIRIGLESLKEMGKEAAAKWLGETILLLTPVLRKEVCGISGS